MIYIVEDDENIGQMECYALKNSGFGTELFATRIDYETIDKLCALFSCDVGNLIKRIEDCDSNPNSTEN